MSKIAIILVNSCLDCPNFSEVNLRCERLERKLDSTEISRVYTSTTEGVPTWCPLDDKEVTND